MVIHNLLTYNSNYSKTVNIYSSSAEIIIPIEPNNTLKGSVSLKFKFASNASANVADANDEEIVVLMKHFRNFWVTLEIPLNDREYNLLLTWSANCVNSYAAGAKLVLRLIDWSMLSTSL